MRVAMAEAKARFADLIRRVEAGEAVVITRHGRPVVELKGGAGAGVAVSLRGAKGTDRDGGRFR